MQTDVAKLLEISAKRGITFAVVDAGLRVFGPPTAVNLLRTHFAANEAAIIEAVAANPMSRGQSPTLQNPRGQGGLEGGAALESLSQSPTPLAILSRLVMLGAAKPTAVDIDLIMWLTQIATIVATDPDPGSIGVDGSAPIRIGDTVASLARGPRDDIRPPETTAQWIDRIHQFKQTMESARQWRSAEYRVRDWPAELRRPPRTVIAPRISPAKPMESTSAK